MTQQLVRDPRTGAMRYQPQMPVGAMQTYRVDLPLNTHWRAASCAEVDCPQYLNGWVTRVVADSDDERLVRRAGRLWVSAARDGGFTVFRFAAGTACFRASTHRIQLDRPALFRLTEGDWRWQGAPRAFSAADWVDHFANHQDKIATVVNRG